MIIVSTKTHMGRVRETLKDVDKMRNGTLAEEKIHQHFAIGLSHALASVQGKSLLQTLEKMKYSYKNEEVITNVSIINQDATQRLKLISRNKHNFSPGRCVNLTACGRHLDHKYRSKH